MNYRHIYHAGNFADVFKHVILIACLGAMHEKASGFCYIDAHAGRGLYDLTSKEAQKNKEFERGVLALMQAQEIIPECQTYLDIIRSFQNDNHLSVYPGSPLIAERLLRKQDYMILNEWHPEEYAQLKSLVQSNPHVHCHHRDAYEFLPAVLPPTPRRGFILLDPPYEKKEEFEDLLNVLPKVLKRFPSGIYAVWYPIKTREHQKFLNNYQQQSLAPTLITELVLSDDYSGEHGLIGCGLLILNPPWKIEEKISKITDFLQRLFQANHHRSL